MVSLTKRFVAGGVREDELVEALRSIHRRDIRFPIGNLANELTKPMGLEADQAWWVYNCIARKMNFSPKNTFIPDYFNSWATYYWCAAIAKPCGSDSPKPKTLYLTWHHAEAPLLLGHISQKGVLIMMAQHSQWMTELVGAENALQFRNLPSVLPLIRAFRDGRPIACMFDYCYPETAAIDVDFLGIPTRTPIGLLSLAIRFGYRLEMITYRDGPVAVSDVEARGQTVESLALWANKILEQQILSDVGQWLLWPSLVHRSTLLMRYFRGS